MICCSSPELHPKLPCTQSSLFLGVLKADWLQPAVPATDSSVAVSIRSWSHVFLSQKETNCSDCQPCSFWGFFGVKLLPLETGTLPSLWKYPVVTDYVLLPSFSGSSSWSCSCFPKLTNWVIALISKWETNGALWSPPLLEQESKCC